MKKFALIPLFVSLSAFAQEAAPVAPSPENDVLSFLKAVYEAITQKDWGKLLFFVVTLLVWACRKFLAKKYPQFASALATIGYTFAISFAGMLATSWPIGGQPSSQSVFLAIQMGFAAAGGWSVVKALLEAASKKYEWAAWLLSKMVIDVKVELKAVETPPAE